VPALSSLWDSITQRLIPCIEDGLGPLSAREAEFVRAAEASGLARHMGPYKYCGNGQRPHGRLPPALAFLAKAAWNVLTTAALAGFLRSAAVPRRLCGWEGAPGVPSESTFSRAFRDFAEGGLPARGGAGAARCRGPGSAWTCRAGGASRRASPTCRPAAPGARSAAPGGRMWAWCGYRLHPAVADGGVPVAPCLTSASAQNGGTGRPNGVPACQNRGRGSRAGGGTARNTPEFCKRLDRLQLGMRRHAGGNCYNLP
jgi:hypothetical protein